MSLEKQGTSFFAHIFSSYVGGFINVIAVYIYSYFRFSVPETGQCSDAVSTVVTNGSVGSHTMISQHHLHCVFAKRKRLQKFVTNCKAARKPTRLLEQLVSKRQLVLSLPADGFFSLVFIFNFLKFFLKIFLRE